MLPNPWKRQWGGTYDPPHVVNAPRDPFTDSILDAHAKQAALKVSPSVVALTSYSGGNQAFWCSGVIFQSFWNNISLNYEYYVLTSATLLRPPASHADDLIWDDIECYAPIQTKDGYIPIDQKIGVCLRGHKLCEGTVVTYDHHYNIAVLTFKSDDRIPCAVFRPLDEPTDAHPSPVKLIPGDAVIALGRYTRIPFEIMAAPGRYSADCFHEKTKLDCMDLLMADCKITKCGIGGPLINREGEVIGLNFYAEDCTPFLPINLFFKWWFHHKVTRSHCRPSLGMKVANLHSDIGILDQVRKLGISQGVIVEKVVSGSPAERCNLHPGDVVFKCSGTMVVSPLQLFDIIWDMAGKTVEVAVVRDDSYENLKIEVKDLSSADEFYQWPLPTGRLRMHTEEYEKCVGGPSTSVGRPSTSSSDVFSQRYKQLLKDGHKRFRRAFSSRDPPIVNAETSEQAGQDSKVHESVVVTEVAETFDVPVEAAVEERIDAESDGTLRSTVMNDSYPQSVTREAKYATRRKASMQKTPSRDGLKRQRNK